MIEIREDEKLVNLPFLTKEQYGKLKAISEQSALSTIETMRLILIKYLRTEWEGIVQMAMNKYFKNEPLSLIVELDKTNTNQ
ncbi:hypothetical protein M1316_01160 [Candidatus Parvarchaeota archaeon]|nr:hypothetical protein [Candidatus Parvarchaeota archaeon]